MKQTKQEYQDQRQEGINRHFDVYPPYNKVKDFRKEFCGPPADSMTFTDDKVSVTLQAVADWQLSKSLGLESTDLKAKREELKLESIEKVETLNEMAQLAREGYSFYHLLKWGCDGFTDNPEYKDVDEGAQANIFATVGVSVHLRAEKITADGVVLTKYLLRNELVNSWLSVFPIQYSFLKETTG